MASVNKVIIMGHIGNDPEVRQFQNGGKVATIRVATTEYWTDRQSGEKKELTEWHTIVLQNRLAEIAEQYLGKGSAVYIEGKLRTRSWEDQQTGQKRYATEIRAESLQMLGGRPQGGQQGGGAPAPRGRGGNGGYQQRGGQRGNGGYQQRRQAAPAPAPDNGAFDEMGGDIPF